MISSEKIELLLVKYLCKYHDDVIKWKHFPRYWPFVRGIYRSHKGQWRGAFMFWIMFSFICAWINGWVNNREAGDLRRHRVHYDVTVMMIVLVALQDLSHKIWPKLCCVFVWYIATFCWWSIYTGGNTYGKPSMKPHFFQFWTANSFLYLADNKWWGSIISVLSLPLMLISK